MVLMVALRGACGGSKLSWKRIVSAFAELTKPRLSAPTAVAASIGVIMLLKLLHITPSLSFPVSWFEILNSQQVTVNFCQLRLFGDLHMLAKQSFHLILVAGAQGLGDLPVQNASLPQGFTAQRQSHPQMITSLNYVLAGKNPFDLFVPAKAGDATMKFEIDFEHPPHLGRRRIHHLLVKLVPRHGQFKQLIQIVIRGATTCQPPGQSFEDGTYIHDLAILFEARLPYEGAGPMHPLQ